MPAIRLTTKRVEKPWGRRQLGAGFDDVAAGGAPVGEIWFELPGGGDPELLVKYLFTSEKLSIQVHPDDKAAQARGLPRGKDEAWVVLAADQRASIGVGMRHVMTQDELRAAAIDGSIEDKLFWKPVKSGDVFYSPAGTVHAIGAGLTLVEVQQNVDCTYRLYDYGRPRELHLDDGVAASRPVPYVTPHVPRELGGGRTALAYGPALVLERWAGARRTAVKAGEGRPIWLIPIGGNGTIDGEPFAPGGVWLVEDDATIDVNEQSFILVAYPGADIIGG
ncbi:mannose-6-phosphate isomerase, type 1 [Sphingomonas laterariae]|uniref:Mannose-6-phosphate isomerase, type 1 n=1 Tax=Edaphosphingomonas laterariae TaxID=861865 RepID=A0A239FF82_9SPHN|nr:class I mannose-6-phosphate isomerase [Sphingomonas laterariae]SNS55421.1 mannose-6-phosphate isomerase, type 1 [Sphingomonas laterariae]